MYNYFDAINKPSIDLNKLAHSALKKYMASHLHPKNIAVNVKEETVTITGELTVVYKFEEL